MKRIIKMTSMPSSLISSEGLVKLLVFLCLVDLIFTIAELEMGWAIEYNPFLNIIIQKFGMVGFSSLKMTITIVCCLVFNTYSDKIIAKAGVLIAIVAYMAVNIYHVLGIILWGID